MPKHRFFSAEKENRKRIVDGIYSEAQLEVFQCNCGSVWCERCAKASKTHGRIQNILNQMDFRRVRHIILTLRRDKPADFLFNKVRSNRSLPNLVRRLGEFNIGLWLWVLEFHIDGYPHWHLLIETSDGKIGQVGKKRLDKLWKIGFTWESYIHSENHWQRIKGYHKYKGYLAGEQKQHQLTLPNYLLDEKVIRKFGSNYHAAPRVSDAAPRRAARKRGKKLKYYEKFAACHTDTTVKTSFSGYHRLQVYPETVKSILEHHNIDKIEYNRYTGKRDTILKALIDCSNHSYVSKKPPK